MTSSSPRPTDDLAAVAAAFGQLLDAVADLDDAAARAPSRLPGWSRGHVLTHVTRSGEADAFTVEGNLIGEEREKYPGGLEQREAGIEAGAGRPAADLVADLVATQARLTAAWDAMPDDAWGRVSRTPVGERTAAEGVHQRRREILVHLVDLDWHAEPEDLPADYVERDRTWLRQYRTTETWPRIGW
jgi:maleylpyruvate isomerase